MDSRYTTGVSTDLTEDAGLFERLMKYLAGLFGSSEANSQAKPGHSTCDTPAEDSDAGATFVMAPGGYRIRVPHPSDVGHSVGEMLPSVREGLALLPPLPTVVVELLREIQDPNSTASSVAEVASSDPSLAASLLRTANGAGMGISRTITSVSEAVSYLGFGTVKAMVIRLRLDQVLKPKNEQAARDAEDLWIHSLAVSYAAECLAHRVNGVDRGFVATLGLLHDIGKLAVLAQLPEEAAKINDAAANAEAGRLAREAAVLGLDHAGLGANLAAKWKLPADLVQAIRWHHRPANAFHPTDPPALRKALHLVQIANQLVKYCFPHTDTMEIDAVGDEAFELLGMDSSLAKLLDKPVRDSISKAMFFADGNSRLPAAAPRRFLRPLSADEARRVTGATDGPEPTVAIDDVLIESMFAPQVPELFTSAGRPQKTPSTKHARFTTPATTASIAAFIAAIKDHLETLNLPAESRSVIAYTTKSLVPNLLALTSANESIEVAQRLDNRKVTLAIRSPGLSAARRLGAGAADPVTIRRVAEADLANVLNLNWFARITISSDGSAIAFEGH